MLWVDMGYLIDKIRRLLYYLGCFLSIALIRGESVIYLTKGGYHA